MKISSEGYYALSEFSKISDALAKKTDISDDSA